MSDESNKPSAESVALTPDQITQIINSAITSHLKRLPDWGKVIDEKLAALPKAPAPEVVADDKGGKAKGQDPQVTALIAKLEEATKVSQQAQERAAAAEKSRREDRALGELRSALIGKVRPEAVDDVSSLLFHVKKMVEIDENGNAFLKVKRAPAPGFAEEDALMPISDGVDHWSKSKAAAIYIPATPPAGAQPPSTPARASKMPSPGQKTPAPKFEGPARSDNEKIQRAMQIEAALKAQGFGQ